MQFLRRGSLFLLVFTSFNYLGLSEKVNPDDVQQVKMKHSKVKRSNTETFNRVLTECQTSPIENLCILFDDMNYLNEFIINTDRDLYIIIADEMENGISIAEYKTKNNRVLFNENNKNNKNLVTNLLYNEIMENYYLYCYEWMTHYYLVYPRNIKNEILAMYLIKKTIDSARFVKVILTSSTKSEYSINRMLQFASSIYEKHDIDINFGDKMNLFYILPKPNVNNYCYMSKQESILIEYFKKEFNMSGNITRKDFDNLLLIEAGSYSVRQKLFIAIIGPIIFQTREEFSLCASYDDIFRERYFQTSFTSLTFNNFLMLDSNNETLKCFREKLLADDTITLEHSHFDVSTLAGVFAFSDYIQTIYNFFLTKKNQISKDNFCKIEHRGILKLMCFIKSMTNPSTYFSDAWTETFENYLQSNLLKEKQEWFLKLESLFYITNEKFHFIHAHQWDSLNAEITKIDLKNQDFMRRAIFTMKNYKIKVPFNFSCSPFKTGNKLQVKAQFIRISEILHKKCPEKIEFIELFAIDKVIFDEDILKIGEEIQINIFAPVWEVVLNRTFNLNGFEADNSWILQTQKCVSASVKEGAPVLPDGLRGTFYGVLSELIVETNFRISSDGGDGEEKKFSCWLQGGGPDRIIGGKGGAGGFQGMIKLISRNYFRSLNFTYPVKNGSDGLSGHDDFDVAVNRYKEYRNTEFYLQSNRTVPHYYNTSYFINELLTLENHYSIHLNKSNFQEDLENWTEEFSTYDSERKESENTDDYTEIILNLKIMVDKRIRKIKYQFYDRPNIMIKEYLSGFIKGSKSLLSENALDSLNTISKQFKMQFEKEIIEANHLINKELPEYMEERIRELNVEFKQFIDEIDDLIKRNKLELRTLEDRKITLNNQIVLRVLFGVIKFALLALSFINPVFAIVGAVGIAGIFTLESLTLDSRNSNFATINVPKVVSQSMDTTFKQYKEKKTKDIALVDKHLSEIKAEREKLSKAGEDVQPLLNVEKKVTELSIDLKSQEPQTSDGMKKLEQILKEEEKQLTASNPMKTKYAKHIKYMNRAAMAVGYTELGVDYVNKISSDLSEKNTLDNMIQECRDGIKNLEYFKEKMQNDLEPKIDQIWRELSNQTDQLALASVAYQKFKSWNIEEYLRSMSNNFESNTKEFKVDKLVVETMRKLKSGMNAMIRLYDLINDFEARIKNTEYMQDMFSAIVFKSNNIRVRQLQQPVTSMLQIHYANSLNDEYENLKSTLIQYTFPFHKQFPDLIEISAKDFIDPVKKVNNAVLRITSFEMELTKLEAKGQPFNEVISSAKFGNDGQLPSFYVWSSSRAASDIENILNGKKVILFANISEHQERNAIKFQDISILFSSSDPQTNEELKKDLRGFQVNLIHNGDSYYKCDDKIQLIKSSAFQLHDQFFDSSRKKRFADYKKLDYVLSPYATWSVQLRHIQGRNEFHKLAKYVNKVQIDLVGEGQYLDLGIDICKDI